MNIIVREYTPSDVPAMAEIWNSVVADGLAFPQTDELSVSEAADFFGQQTYCAVAEDTDGGGVLGLYILHPNNVGRCGHISNASYAVAKDSRGLHIGEKLVTDCLNQAARCGFRLLQFNAVVKTNGRARKLYERLGFNLVGTVPEGFLMKDGHYEDICIYYHTLSAEKNDEEK